MNPADIFKSSLFGQSSPSMIPSQTKTASSLFAGPSGSFSTPKGAMQSSIPTPIPSGPQSKLPATSSTGGNASATTPKAAYINSQTNTPAVSTPSTAPVNPTSNVNPNAAYQGNTISAPIDQNSPQAQYQKAFDTYLASLTPSDAETEAEKNLAAQNLQAQKDNDYALEKPGQTLGFASGEAARVARNNAYQTDALSNSLNSLTNARTARTTATKAQLDFEKGLYDDSTAKAAAAAKPDFTTVGAGGTVFDNKTGKAVYTAPTTASQNGTGTSSGGGAYVEGANPAIDGWVAAINNKQATIANVPAALRSAVAGGLASNNQNDQLKTDALTSAQQLLNSFDNSSGFLGIGGSKSAVGTSSFLPVVPGTQAANFVANLDSLKALLSLDNVKYLKGQGAVSDAERGLLASAATQLSRSQSEDQFKTTLQDIITKLQKFGSTAGGGSSAPAATGGDDYQAYLKAIGQ